jgi:hypothetical protein
MYATLQHIKPGQTFSYFDWVECIEGS